MAWPFCRAATATSPAAPTIVETTTDDAISPSSAGSRIGAAYQLTTSDSASESSTPAATVAASAAHTACVPNAEAPAGSRTRRAVTATPVPAMTRVVLNAALIGR